MFWGGCAVGTAVDPDTPRAPQVSRRLLSKPQDALEGVVLSVSGAAYPWDLPARAGLRDLPGVRFAG